MNITNNDNEQTITMFHHTIGTTNPSDTPISLYTTSKEEWMRYKQELRSVVFYTAMKYLLYGVLVGVFLGFFTYAKADTPANVKQKIIKQAPNKDVATTLLAIAFIESSLNVKAKGRAGEQGLFQFHPKYFDLSNIKTTDQQIKKAVEHYQYLKDYCKMPLALCWNRGIKGAEEVKQPKKDKYYKKFELVKAEYEKAIKDKRATTPFERKIADSKNSY